MMPSHSRITIAVALAVASLSGIAADRSQIIFEETFQKPLSSEWRWTRENPAGWRMTPEGLQVRVEPGNMWGGANNARNILWRELPAGENLEARLDLENHPTEQYEQVDLVWYYDDSHMVKLGLEQVDGKWSIVMGREEADKTRTIAIIPFSSSRVEVRFQVHGETLKGSFRSPGENVWREAGECSLPVKGKPKISIQCYQGPAQAERWALLRRLTLMRL